MEWRSGITFKGNKSGRIYRVQGVQSDWVSLEDKSGVSIGDVRKEVLEDMDILILETPKTTIPDVGDFYPLFEINKYLNVDTELWERFCSENKIVGVSPVVEKYLPESINSYLHSANYLFDHLTLCLSSQGNTVVLVANPYLKDSEIDVLCQRLEIRNYVVLGKDRSFYYPNVSNLVVFGLDGEE